MKRISYADDFILTDDGIADTVMEYAAQLARAERSDVVQIPALDHDGRLTQASMVLGPASQLMAVPDEHPPVDMDAAVAIRDLQDKMDELRSPRGIPPYSGDDPDYFEDL